MAKGDVTMVFDAQTAEFVARMQKMREGIIASADSMRKFGDDTKNAGDKAAEGIGNAAKAFEKLAEGATIGEAIKLSMEVWNDWMERAAGRTEVLLKKTNDLAAALAAAGQAGQVSEVRSRIESLDTVAGMPVNREQATTMFSGISSEIGSRATVDEKFAGLKAGLQGRAAHMSEEAATRLGATYARLMHEGVDADKYAYPLATAYPGGLSERHLRFLARAEDKEGALKLLLAGAASEESARSLSSFQQAAAAEISPQEISKLQDHKRHHPRTFSAEDERKLRLSAIAPENREAAMLADDSLAPDTVRPVIRNLKEHAAHLPPTRSLADEIAYQRTHGDQAQRLADEARDIETQGTRFKEVGAIPAATFTNIRKRNEEQFAFEHPELAKHFPFVSSIYTDVKSYSDYAGRGAVAGDSPDLLPGTDPESIKENNRRLHAAFYKSRPDLVDPDPPAPAMRAGRASMPGQGPYGDPTLAVLQQMHNAIQEQNNLLRTRGSLTLSNHLEGQK